MRRTQPVRIGEIVSDFFKNNTRLSRMLAEARSVDVWEDVVGRDIAKYTTRINVSNGRMFIYISSSVIRHEVFMRRRSIIEKINNAVGENIISSIIVK